MSKGSEDDHEHDEGWDPAPVLVCVDDLVSGECDEESANGDYENTGETRYIGVHCDDELGTYDGVCCRPAHAGEDIEDSD